MSKGLKPNAPLASVLGTNLGRIGLRPLSLFFEVNTNGILSYSLWCWVFQGQPCLDVQPSQACKCRRHHATVSTHAQVLLNWPCQLDHNQIQVLPSHCWASGHPSHP